MGEPYRGEIYETNLNPIKGSEIKGIKRPVLIVQNHLVTKRVMSIIGIPFTKNIKRRRWPFTVFVKKDNLNGLKKDSVLLCHQIRVLDKSRLGKKIGEMSEDKLTEVENAILYTLGINV